MRPEEQKHPRIVDKKLMSQVTKAWMPYHPHHLVLKSHGGDDVIENLYPLLPMAHDSFHRGDEEVAELIRASLIAEAPESLEYIINKKGKYYLDKYYPDKCYSKSSEYEGENVHADGEVGSHAVDPSVRPGEECPACHRRIPYPKKDTSPKSAMMTYRIPLDVKEDYKELVDAAAEHAGIKKEKYHTFQVLNAGLVLVLQQPKGFLADSD
jgi:hypothetical protein